MNFDFDETFGSFTIIRKIDMINQAITDLSKLHGEVSLELIERYTNTSEKEKRCYIPIFELSEENREALLDIFVYEGRKLQEKLNAFYSVPKEMNKAMTYQQLRDIKIFKGMLELIKVRITNEGSENVMSAVDNFLKAINLKITEINDKLGAI